MGKELNNSSINTKKSDKIVSKIKQNKNAGEKAFSQNNKDEQVINARKGANYEAQRAARKKKAKAAKASRKKNKK